MVSVIREARVDDIDALLAVERAAFGSDSEAELVKHLLDDKSAVPVVSLVACIDERIVGHILFTRAVLEPAPATVTCALLAPLAVAPDTQNQGIGAELIRHGFKHLAGLGTDLVFVLGYPAYYSRHGFEPAGRLGLTAPYPIADEHADAWMVHALRGDLLGQVKGRVACAKALDKEEYWIE